MILLRHWLRQQVDVTFSSNLLRIFTFSHRQRPVSPLAYNMPMADIVENTTKEIAFPALDRVDIAALSSLATCCEFEDGQVIFRAGQPDLDLFVLESGGIEIINPSDENRHVI